ncbi:MAG: pitrilysin family protein [Saprospiraceae bacterium]
MINFKKITLKNGLRFIYNIDKSTPLVAFNIMYNVGSKNEKTDKTGLAHFFEHLMFSGTPDIDDFDYYTQICGGDNNAFTNNDNTDFYLTLPAENLEMAFCLEADRMNNLSITKQKFSTEKKVVIEEFKETTLNVPYGEMWHVLSEMSYTKHPYMWPTIGKNIQDIEKMNLEDVMEFYSDFYVPENAIIAVSGNFDEETILGYLEKWFGNIQKKSSNNVDLDIEPKQDSFKQKTIVSDVPSNAIYLAFHVDGRNGKNYYIQDLISDILGRGRSARLYQNLVKKNQLFTEIHAYMTGTNDPGLLIIEGLVNDGIYIAKAENALFSELEKLKTELISDEELTKLKNKMINQLAFEELNILYKAMNLCQFESIGNIDMINSQMEYYQDVNQEQIKKESNELFKLTNCSKLIYKKEK